MRKLLTASILFTGFFVQAQEINDSIKKNKLKIFGNYETNAQWYTNDVNRGIKHDTVPLRSNNYLSLNYLKRRLHCLPSTTHHHL
jgi:hypothetical protein